MKLSKADRKYHGDPGIGPAATVAPVEIESYHRANARKESALADQREMERDELRGQLLRADAVRTLWSERHAALRDRLAAIPDRLAAVVVGVEEPEARVRMRDEIEQALREHCGADA